MMMNDSSIDGCPRRTYYFDRIGELKGVTDRAPARPSEHVAVWMILGEARHFDQDRTEFLHMNRPCRKRREEFRTDSYACGCQFEKWRERFVLNSAVATCPMAGSRLTVLL